MLVTTQITMKIKNMTGSIEGSTKNAQMHDPKEIERPTHLFMSRSIIARTSLGYLLPNSAVESTSSGHPAPAL